MSDNAVSAAVYRIAGARSGRPKEGDRKAAAQRAAGEIGVGVETVYRWIRIGGVPDSGDLVALIDALLRSGRRVTLDDVRSLAYDGRRHARAV